MYIKNLLMKTCCSILYVTAPLWKDELYLKCLFWSRLGYRLNMKNPKTFNEKLQWLKCYNKSYNYNKYVDKFEVKKYITTQIGIEYVIPTLGIYDKIEDIDFGKLPDSYVMKTTNDSGGIVICKDNKLLDKKKTLGKIKKALKRDFVLRTREYQYKGIQPRIIIEKYMVDESGEELKDYKFFVFNGKVKFLKVDFNRFNASGHRANYYNADFEILDWTEVICPPDFQKEIKKPEGFCKMIDLAEKLSNSLPFVRVDFYNVNGRIYFGELTFYPDSGFGKFLPDEVDRVIGNMLVLPSKNV